jgi:alpha-D-ribose 1-methylphosphonate 5-triphosphate diphosphatase
MNNWLIQRANIVTPTEVIPDGFLRVERGIITEMGTGITDVRDAHVLDAAGAVLMPGIIDIHTDAMDIEIVPRPGADIPVSVAFRELERKMAACGITTVYHSMHLGYEVAEKQSRSGFSRRDVFEQVAAAAAGPTLINNKIHLRFELSGIEAYDDCLRLLEEGSIALLSVMDHTPGQGQFTRKHFKEFVLSQGKTEADFEAEIRERFERPRIEGERLETMISLALDYGIPVATHDDDTPEKIDMMRALGVSISEFPINMETAQYAASMGLHTAGGASNVLRGGSLSGNLDMTEAIKAGAVGILSSDYYPAAILHSVFKLHREHGLSLPRAVNLATLNPAKAMGIHEKTGSLGVGKRADLLLVQHPAGLPMVTHTMVSGSLVVQTAFKSASHARPALS